jgi:hypothetical protein
LLYLLTFFQLSFIQFPEEPFLERLGFVLTTFVLLSFLLGWIERTNWPRSLGVASAAALGSFAIFELWLKIRLPKGIFGF